MGVFRLVKRVVEPGWEIISLFKLLLILPLLLSKFLGELAWAKEVDRLAVQDPNSFPLSFKSFLDLGLKNFIGLCDKVGKLDLHQRSVNLVLNVVDI